MSNPDWWLARANIARDAISLAATDAGLPLRDLSVTVTGGIESAPDYAVAALNTYNGVNFETSGTGVDDGGFGGFRDGFLSDLQ